jgi:hypothetical protein
MIFNVKAKLMYFFGFKEYHINFNYFTKMLNHIRIIQKAEHYGK